MPIVPTKDRPLNMPCDDPEGCKHFKAEMQQSDRIFRLEALRDTVSINCKPPKDCNDPVILKNYMTACFNEAQKLYD